MKLTERKNMSRRDFTGVYKCEHCDHVQEASSYDDNHFHLYVIPKMACRACGKTAPADAIGTRPLHPDSELI